MTHAGAATSTRSLLLLPLAHSRTALPAAAAVPPRLHQMRLLTRTATHTRSLTARSSSCSLLLPRTAAVAATAAVITPLRTLSTSAPLPPLSAAQSTPAATSTPAAAAGAPAASFKTRQSQQVLLSREQSEGAGARVRRSIGRPELRNFDPFLMLDEFSLGKKGGFPDHPHRGASCTHTGLAATGGSAELRRRHAVTVRRRPPWLARASPTIEGSQKLQRRRAVCLTVALDNH